MGAIFYVYLHDEYRTSGELYPENVTKKGKREDGGENYDREK